MNTRSSDFPPFSVDELTRVFADPESAKRFPAILSVPQAAELLQVPVATIYDWSSRGLLDRCAKKIGKHLRISRDRLIQEAFNNFQTTRKGPHVQS